MLSSASFSLLRSEGIRVIPAKSPLGLLPSGCYIPYGLAVNQLARHTHVLQRQPVLSHLGPHFHFTGRQGLAGGQAQGILGIAEKLNDHPYGKQSDLPLRRPGHPGSCFCKPRSASNQPKGSTESWDRWDVRLFRPQCTCDSFKCHFDCGHRAATAYGPPFFRETAKVYLQ